MNLHNLMDIASLQAQSQSICASKSLKSIHSEPGFQEYKFVMDNQVEQSVEAAGRFVDRLSESLNPVPCQRPNQSSLACLPLRMEAAFVCGIISANFRHHRGHRDVPTRMAIREHGYLPWIHKCPRIGYIGSLMQPITKDRHSSAEGD